MCIALQQNWLQGHDERRRLRCVALQGSVHSRTFRPKHLGTHPRPHTRALVQEQGAVGVHAEAAAVVVLDQCTQRYVPRTPTARAAGAARMAFDVDEDESVGVVHAADED